MISTPPLYPPVGYRVFQKGGLRPAIRNAGGGAVRFRPDTKSGGRGCCPLQAQYEKRRGGGGGGWCPFKARYKKRGEGVLSASGPIRKAEGRGGGVAVHLRPDTKSGGGGGGGRVLLSGASGTIQNTGKGEGLFSRRGGVTIYERGDNICNPQNPPLDPPLYIHTSVTYLYLALI